MTNRLFIALDLPESTIEYIVKLRDEIYNSSEYIKWESNDKLHLTIKFLGDVGDYLTELIIDRLEILSFSKINTEFTEFNFFKKNNEIKIVFAELKENSELNNLHTKIEEEFALLGFEQENRKFKPHLTLLRIKGNEDLNKLLKFKKLTINHKFTIKSFSLLKSELKPNGSEYSIIKRFNLK
jgi:RNA 2',3'-cyclic 3'-phosphodiesterase